MSKQIAFYVEQKHCTGCSACQIACKDKHDLPPGQNFRQIHAYEGGGFTVLGSVVHHNTYAYWVPISCNHCVDAPCVAVCPSGAMYKRPEDGLVLINEKSCIGCRRCFAVCPYQAPQFDAATSKMKKCDFCQDLLLQGTEPACVSACPMRVLGYGELKELQKKYGSNSWVKGLPNTAETKPAWVLIPHRDAVDTR
ncbi:DMSO/selenate family reductase complex B subunit [Pelosinus propionicus]|uniref:Anaerobic dimethyl sulfoxide reductase subunit B (DMSO reductase iron-sulfur subunit) n=1 Tax=Pelosinus propionicus DSM 13327 TaxID=1123291 RepID=A0A1I4PWC2_9FIRM|nr:DMSO/selenate family reductase complex B subunit [Pelosinus propionicus]SFM31896.1 anaerobic dimethyl sulfoxide reductase subunit B (DMSO reductase iron-sulfur subunit) [Pelosinus propionicus DSM 13327]